MKTILAVDDDTNILESLDFILRGEGYKTLLASDAQTAEYTVRTKCPDLVVMDIRLPDYPGTQVTKKLKSELETKHIPIILISANYDAKATSKHAGADAFLEKPFDIQDLTTAIKRYIH